MQPAEGRRNGIWCMGELFGFLDPVIEEERKCLITRYNLTEEGAKSAADLLRKRLGKLTEPLVLKLFNEELQRIAPVSALGSSFANEEQKREAREAAAEKLTGSESPFLKYPEMELYSQRICVNFRRFMDSLLSRLSENREGIGRELLYGKPMGKLLSLSASGADCHLHGSCALRVGTEGGTFYYKPRDLGPDELFRTLAQRFFEGRIYAPRVLNTGNFYGFVEAIQDRPLEKEGDLSAYFRNFGILLALFRSLGSNDMHYENIVASGIFPVCIDLETIITPVYRILEGTVLKSLDEMDEIHRDIFFSSANTMVLPMMLQGKLQMSPLLETNARCLPEYNGKRRSVYGFENEFMSGFGEGYDTIAENREEIHSLLGRYSKNASRFVLRSSSYYAITLQEMHSEAFLEDPAKKERELLKLGERLKNLSETGKNAITCWERESLEEGDIPYFSIKADEKSLYGAPSLNPLVEDFFSISALEHARLCLSHMGPEEKRFELDYLRVRFRQAADKASPPILNKAYSGPDHSVLERSAPGNAEKANIVRGEANKEDIARGEADKEDIVQGEANKEDTVSGNANEEGQLTAAEALKLSEELFWRILELKVTSAKGTPFFLSYDGNLTPQSMPGLKNGMQGMALFFDLFRKLVPGRENEAEECMEYCRADTKRQLSLLSHYEPGLLGRSMLGLENGIGGILLSPSLSADGAKQLLSCINDEVLKACSRSTLEEGLAGLAVGLSAWKNKGLDQDINRLIPYIIERLLQAETADMSAGLMRGKAGLACALSSCEELTESIEQRHVCKMRREELFREIRSEYSEKLSAWPDQEKLDRPLFPAFDLEKGGPGIGLAAAGCSHELLRLSADSICRKSLLPTDTVLKGNAGSALLLMKAAETLKENQYLDSCGRLLWKMTERAGRDGGFRVLEPSFTMAPDPSFLMGYAGIGYAFLHYAEMLTIQHS